MTLTLSRPRTLLSELAVLFKLRVVALLLFSSLAGALLGAQGWPGWGPTVLLLLAAGSSAAGASALNQYIEQDKDAKMDRTRQRPLVTGSLGHPGWVLAAAVILTLGPVALLLPYNPPLALSLFLGAFVYIVIYTLWLKPRTSLNIVIGGAAGSLMVISGGAAVGAWNAPGVLLLGLLVFLWTPIHFWSLAMVYREDYSRANVPMLPVKTGQRTAAVWSLLHGVGATGVGVWLVLLPGNGPFVAGLVFLASAVLLYQGIRLVITPTKRFAWRLFHTSNLYLFVVLLAACAAAVMRFPG